MRKASREHQLCGQECRYLLLVCNGMNCLPKGTWKRYGGDIAVAAFWYAFAEAIKSNAPGPDLERFRLVARTAEENWGLVVLIFPACRLFTVCHLSAQEYPFLFPFLPDRSRKVCSSNGVA